MNCRSCGATVNKTFVDLGEQPLANSYLHPDELDRSEPRYPLHVRVCEQCFLVQVPSVVPREAIFSADYAYFSSYSSSWVEHARRYSVAAIERFGLGNDNLVVEKLARVLDRPSPVTAVAGRTSRHLRATAETRIAVRLGLDGSSRVAVQTGGGIYDHFLEQLAFHAGLDLIVEASGDLETGDHHTVEDTALAFGEALDRALGDRRGIARYGDAVVPMDDALARAAVDLGGRPYAELSFETEPGMAAHFFTSLAQAARMAIHIEATGRDAHHTAEAAYKAVGRALKTAIGVESSGIPSTKGLL